MCQNTTMRVNGAWIKRYCVLCSKTYNTLHSCHNFSSAGEGTLKDMGEIKHYRTTIKSMTWELCASFLGTNSINMMCNNSLQDVIFDQWCNYWKSAAYINVNKSCVVDWYDFIIYDLFQCCMSRWFPTSHATDTCLNGDLHTEFILRPRQKGQTTFSNEFSWMKMFEFR